MEDEWLTLSELSRRSIVAAEPGMDDEPCNEVNPNITTHTRDSVHVGCDPAIDDGISGSRLAGVS
jgi:hypothetical protein